MSVAYYHHLLSDGIRIQAFRQAIEAEVRAGDRVLEIGAGLGTFSFLAARAGAGHVWAVDGDAVIHVAETLARLNGFHDSVTCIRGWIPEVDLPGRVDLILYEDFVPSLFDAATYRMLRSAIRKYLTPGGRMLPRHAAVYVAPVSSVDLRSRLFPLEAWPDDLGIDWSPSLSYLANLPTRRWLPESALAGPPRVLYEVDFPALPQPSSMGGEAEWTMEPGTDVHALALWFDVEPGAGSRVTNAPKQETGPWGQVILPVDPPLPVEDSGRLVARVGYDETDDGAPGWMRWSVTSGMAHRAGHEFAGTPADLADLFVNQPQPAQVKGPHNEAKPAPPAQPTTARAPEHAPTTETEGRPGAHECPTPTAEIS